MIHIRDYINPPPPIITIKKNKKNSKIKLDNQGFKGALVREYNNWAVQDINRINQKAGFQDKEEDREDQNW